MVRPARAARSLVRTALVIDPDHDTRDLYSLMLAGVAHDVEVVDDGRIGLAKALAKRPDLLVTETHVPFIDGYTLCRLLRSDSVTASVPIVVATSDGTAASVRRAWTAGASAVLLKPFAIEPFIATIREVLEAQAVPPDAVPPNSLSKEMLARAARTGSRMKARIHQRYTTVTPPVAPPELACPRWERGRT